MSAVISNGFGQFHLRGLAVELERRHELNSFITGMLPPEGLERLPARLQDVGAIRRWAERRVDIPRSLTRQAPRAEGLHQLSQRLRSAGQIRLADRAAAASFASYSMVALSVLNEARTGGEIYHVRAGVGGRSIDHARAQGRFICCDHSIAAPAVIDSYVPQAPPTALMPRMWSKIQADIERSDAIIVNSDFVAETFEEAGVNRGRVHVAYTPVDEKFAAQIDSFETPRTRRPVITFAGTAEYRKGIDVVIDVANKLGEAGADWRVIGGWSPDALELRVRMPEFVKVEPKKSRFELARVLAETDIFLFPSRAEGSARVVAEALRAGCQVVTTRMSGSATRESIDGHVHATVDDTDAIAESISRILSRSPEDRSAAMITTKAFARERLSVHRYVDDVWQAYSTRELR